MALFTFILEIGGGTYISQYAGRSAEQALKKWASTEPSGLARLTGAQATAIRQQIGNEQLISIEGVQNVWCITASIGRRLAVLNVIKSSPAR
jgi:hypothetical protein